MYKDRFKEEESMPKKRFRPEDIIAKLREADIHISQGKTVAETVSRQSSSV